MRGALMQRLLTVTGLSLIVSLTLISSPLHAADTSDKGLSISPLRKEVSVMAGTESSGYFTVANLTSKPMDIEFSVREFSVTEFIYDYKFHVPGNDWVKLKKQKMTLQPGKNERVWYDIVSPEKTTPGGYYFALFASTKVDGDGLPGTIQAVSLLYTKVEGKLLTTSVLQNDSAPFFVMGDQVDYKFHVKNTGNIHFSAYFYGKVEGLLGMRSEQGTSHLVMPNVPREIKGSVPSPFLPGIYKFTYGYKVDFADIITSKTTYILYMPLWSLVTILLIGILGSWLWQRYAKKSKSTAKG